MEYYDYGLALLSYELCWTPYQMANLEVNVARQTHAELKEYHEEIVRLINYPEFMLYEYFNTTFWEKGMDFTSYPKFLRTFFCHRRRLAWFRTSYDCMGITRKNIDVSLKPIKSKRNRY